MSEDKSLLSINQPVSNDDIVISPELAAVLEKANSGATETINSALASAKFINGLLLGITGYKDGLFGNDVNLNELSKLTQDKIKLTKENDAEQGEKTA